MNLSLGLATSTSLRQPLRKKYALQSKTSFSSPSWNLWSGPTCDEVLPGVDLCELWRLEEALWQRDERVVADVHPLQLSERTHLGRQRRHPVVRHVQPCKEGMKGKFL